MGIYIFERTQKLPASRELVWDFISAPANLKKITPPYMGFDILTPKSPERMYPGHMISYHVSPVFGLKMTWVTEITQVKELEYFVDEQRVGPYSIWHHEHHLEDIQGGVLMRDIIHYQPPMWFLGDIANSLVIKDKLEEIFAFRKTAMENEFGKFPEA